MNTADDFLATASAAELVELVGGPWRLRHLAQRLNDAIGDELAQRRRTVAVGVVRTPPDGPPRLVFTASNNRVGGNVQRVADELGITQWGISDSALRAKGRASRRTPDVPGAPGDAEQRLIEIADQNGMEVVAAVPSRRACLDCVSALEAEGAVLIDPLR